MVLMIISIVANPVVMNSGNTYLQWSAKMVNRMLVNPWACKYESKSRDCTRKYLQAFSFEARSDQRVKVKVWSPSSRFKCRLMKFEDKTPWPTVQYASADYYSNLLLLRMDGKN